MTDRDAFPPSRYGASRTYRAEDDLSRRGGRVLARVLSPVVAVVPWLVTFAAVWAMAHQTRLYSMRLQTHWGWLLGALALFLVAALLWAAVTAWSSLGTTLAGLGSVAFGAALSIPTFSREVYSLAPGSAGREFWYVVTPGNFLLVGSLLLAGGLGAAGARRRRR